MAKFIRYALATIFFTASVACLALWWRSYTIRDMTFGPSPRRPDAFYLETFRGSIVSAYLSPVISANAPAMQAWGYSAEPIPSDFEFIDARRTPVANFGRTTTGGYYFPLWYAALIFALAGIAALRFRRQFSIRSALIAMAVIAALLGMVLIL